MNRQQDTYPPSSPLAAPTPPGWAILPLRIFLGISFLAAGLDKLGDPSYLDPAARDYIGKQIGNFALGTPLEGFLLNVAVPNAALFGVLVMGGELCIGIATLLGLLTRPAAAMGVLINLTFFLSATWDVRPFYFGADLPYAVAWLTLLLAGPGPFAFDYLVSRWLLMQPAIGALNQPEPAVGRTALTRRAFLAGGVAGLVASVLAATGLGWGVLHAGRAEAVARAVPTPTPKPAVAPEPTQTNTVQAVQAPAEEPTANPTPTEEAQPPPTETAVAPTEVAVAPPIEAPTEPAAARTLLAASDVLPVGQGLQFLLPTGEPAVLVHDTGGYDAYVAICTHRACTVRLTAAGILKCPCHGAEYDPAHGAEVIRGPAPRPLSRIDITVDPDGSVYLAG